MPADPNFTAEKAPPSRRRLIIVGAIAAVVVLVAAGAGLAFYLRAPSGSGVAACQRVDGIGADLADGGTPVLSPDELREIADGLAGSENEALSHFGREYLRWALAGEPDRFKGAQGASYLHSQVLPACMVAGVEMTTSI
ncbi:hypothetical protein J2S43_002112 [Catenuloplanes nepalensis]|uniref:Uncharacterized protein n=1 Tax=Catenuloplanes nepalensis TaxID=587533 RepID=A0ABT9MQA7_9ACTN|nr:hypothetical protein [Catenuloplanes nepalensis]MDP9793600.1 hypothetical protein [Catenuloplanes nepalensis]